jgi:ABC-type multidrug transport system fused ATPase/permease subunit
VLARRPSSKEISQPMEPRSVKENLEGYIRIMCGWHARRRGKASERIGQHGLNPDERPPAEDYLFNASTRAFSAVAAASAFSLFASSCAWADLFAASMFALVISALASACWVADLAASLTASFRASRASLVAFLFASMAAFFSLQLVRAAAEVRARKRRGVVFIMGWVGCGDG